MTPQELQGVKDILTRVQEIKDAMQAEAAQAVQTGSLSVRYALTKYAGQLERAIGGEGGVNA